MSHNSCRIHSLNGAIVKRYATNTYDLHVMLVVIDIVFCLIISLFCCCCFIYVSYNILERIDVVGFRVEGKAVEETCCKPVEGKQTVEFSITFSDDKYFYVSMITFSYVFTLYILAHYMVAGQFAGASTCNQSSRRLDNSWTCQLDDIKFLKSHIGMLFTSYNTFQQGYLSANCQL